MLAREFLSVIKHLSLLRITALPHRTTLRKKTEERIFSGDGYLVPFINDKQMQPELFNRCIIALWKQQETPRKEARLLPHFRV